METTLLAVRRRKGHESAGAIFECRDCDYSIDIAGPWAGMEAGILRHPTQDERASYCSCCEMVAPQVPIRECATARVLAIGIATPAPASRGGLQRFSFRS